MVSGVAISQALEHLHAQVQSADSGSLQFRHARGHLVREEMGLEAAQAVLGHASIQATQIYSAKQHKLARRAVVELGQFE